MDRAPTLYVVARYYVDQHYGGPEEGGWWYDAGELDKVVLATRSKERAWAGVRRLNDLIPKRNREHIRWEVVELPRRELDPRIEPCHYGMYDVPDPSDYVVRWDIPEYFPERRPHYC
jgi:Zn-finger nucleic acid-binding protein